MNEQIVSKKWGGELWFANNENYCGKLLWINKRQYSSDGLFHYHKVKDETFFVIEGALILDYEEDGQFYSITLKPKQSFRIFPGVKHRFSCPEGWDHCKFIEASTTHSDQDSYRCEWDKVEGKWIEK